MAPKQYQFKCYICAYTSRLFPSRKDAFDAFTQHAAQHKDRFVFEYELNPVRHVPEDFLDTIPEDCRGDD